MRRECQLSLSSKLHLTLFFEGKWFSSGTTDQFADPRPKPPVPLANKDHSSKQFKVHDNYSLKQWEKPTSSQD